MIALFGKAKFIKNLLSKYHIATPTEKAKPIYDFTITKDGKFSWKATFDDEVEPK
ncbi:hypothetical protein SAMN05444362_103129 [Dysgonomonas macrotermitis]|uniref:Uncharacterized protein n=1 Tax=Dysgonomonas macrotermitis TaxID=1346286 RepID=A0A1M4YBW6_9BACT|nr:hypothetical protein SAMN05444362_103129 [Dysgonomonas macrotermitis]